jgi:hypothetical protein
MSDAGETCCWPGCRSNVIELRWLGAELCGGHWVEVCHLQERGSSNDEILDFLGVERVEDPGLKYQGEMCDAFTDGT